MVRTSQVDISSSYPPMNHPYFQDSLSFSFPQRPPAARRPDTGVWPCTLDGCSKVFAREADLKRHQRTTKGHSIPGSSTGSPCPLCDATFTRSDAMRRHLKSRHGGKTPESLTLQDTTQASSSSASSAARSRRPHSPDDFTDSDGEQGHHTVSSSRAPSAAPPQPYYNPVAPPQHAQHNSHLSPAILYQAAMAAATPAYEIQHALSPRPSAASPPAMSTANTSAMRHSHETSTRRTAHAPQHQATIQPGYQQFPTEDYYGPPSQPTYNPYGPPPTGYTGGASMYAEDVYSSSRGSGFVSTQAAGSRSPFRQQEPPPSGLAALALHASQIRPLSPLPKQKTKSELESALGPPYTR